MAPTVMHAGTIQHGVTALKRILLNLALTLVTIFSVGAPPRSTVAQSDACEEYETQAQAQAALDTPGADDELGLALDADLDGIACPDLEPAKERSVPLAEDLPDDLTEAEAIEIVDGDTIKVRIQEGEDECHRLSTSSTGSGSRWTAPSIG